MTVKGFRVHTRRFNRTLKYLKKVIQHMDEYEGITHTNISFIRCCHVIRINNHLCFHFNNFFKHKYFIFMCRRNLNNARHAIIQGCIFRRARFY